MATITKGKIYYLDWLRIAACIAVVAIHCGSTALDNHTIAEIGTARAFGWVLVFDVLVRWAVPVFFMISGALLLNPQKQIGWPKVAQYVKRMVIALAIFGTGYALMELLFTERTFNVAMLPLALLKVLQGESWSHLWYLYDLLGLYLLLPVFRSYVATADKKSYGILLAILAVFTSLVPMLNKAFALNIETLIWLTTSAFYFLLGYYLNAYGNWNNSILAIGCGSTVLEGIIAGGGVLMGSYLSWAWANSSPFVLAQSAAIFLFAKAHCGARIPEGSLPSYIAAFSFGIYLVHPVFANLLYKAVDWLNAPLPPVVYELATFGILFGCSFILVSILKRLPIFRSCL